MLRLMLSNGVLLAGMFVGVVLIGNAARLVEKACFSTGFRHAAHFAATESVDIKPVVKPAAAVERVVPVSDVTLQREVAAFMVAGEMTRELKFRREARQAFAIAGLVSQVGRGLQRYPHPFVAIPATLARQAAVQVQVAAMADLDLISPNPVIAMGQGFLIGF